MLQGRAVTLNFKVGTQMLRATHGLNMVVISVKLFLNPTSNNEVMGRTQMGRTDGRTDGRTRRRLHAPPKFFGEHNKRNSNTYTCIYKDAINIKYQYWV